MNKYDTLQEDKTSIVPQLSNEKILFNRRNRKIQSQTSGKNKESIFQKVFVSVAKYETIRALLAASVSDEIYVYQMDVIPAYIQGELHDEIFMEQPEMLIRKKQKDKICKLFKFI